MSQEPTEPGKGQEPGQKQEPAGNGGQQPQNGGGQEPKTFDEDYVKQLRAEAADWRTKAQSAQSKVDEFENASKSDREKLEERATKAERAAAERESKLLRYEVAAAKGVPLEDAHRLVGSTKEELEKDAEAFAQRLNGRRSGGQLDGGARGSGQPVDDMDALIRRAAGRG